MTSDAALVSSTTGRAVTRRSTSGSLVRSSYQPQAEEHDDGADEQADRGGAAPAPVGALGDTEEQAEQAEAEADRTDRVEAPARR